MIEKAIEEHFANAIRKASSSGQSERDHRAVHISEASYGCSRKLFYSTETRKSDDDVDINSLYRMWIGTKLHETPITEKHEVPLRIQRHGVDVHGTIDEIFEIDGKLVLADKKFVARLPEAMFEHHRNQVMFYAVMLNDTRGVQVDMVSLIYFMPIVSYGNDQRMRVFTAVVTKETIDTYRERLNALIDDVAAARLTRRLPSKSVSWYCRYCPFKQLCDGDALPAAIE